MLPEQETTDDPQRSPKYNAYIRTYMYSKPMAPILDLSANRMKDSCQNIYVRSTQKKYVWEIKLETYAVQEVISGYFWPFKMRLEKLRHAKSIKYSLEFED